MRPLLLALAAAMLAGAGAAQAQSKPAGIRLQVQPTLVEQTQRSSSFTLPSDAATVRETYGFTASVAVSPNTTIGFGRFYSPPRRRVSIQDQPITIEPRKSRRAAVGLSLRF